MNEITKSVIKTTIGLMVKIQHDMIVIQPVMPFNLGDDIR